MSTYESVQSFVAAWGFAYRLRTRTASSFEPEREL